MWRRSPSNRQAGFTLTEVLVTLISLVIILTVSAQLLFATRRAAVRQQLQVEARQLARGAVDYMHFMLRGASDLNSNGSNSNPTALLVWAGLAGGGTQQCSYNNVTDPTLADIGTDILTFAHAESTATLATTGGFNFNTAAPDYFWYFRVGCPDDATRDAAFDRLTGRVGSQSRWMVVADRSGTYRFFRATNYVADMTCSSFGACAEPCVHVQSDPTVATYYIPPDGTTPVLPDAPRLHAGVGYITLRVRNGWLEQKNDIFDPNTDNPGTAFVPLLPNVEDLQFAYIFRDGSLWNNTPANRLAGTGNVPTQGNSANADDAANVFAVRISITVRSAAELPDEVDNRFIQPVSEDHDPTADSPPKVRGKLYHYQLSTLALIRNRSMQS